jgi:hypothetical protein
MNPAFASYFTTTITGATARVESDCERDFFLRGSSLNMCEPLTSLRTSAQKWDELSSVEQYQQFLKQDERRCISKEMPSPCSERTPCLIA